MDGVKKILADKTFFFFIITLLSLFFFKQQKKKPSNSLCAQTKIPVWIKRALIKATKENNKQLQQQRNTVAY